MPGWPRSSKIAVIMAAKGGIVGRHHRRRLRRAAGDRRRRRAPGQTGMPAARSSTSCCAHGARSATDAPAAMRVFAGRGQPTCEQLIDRYHIACRPVRDVLVDYLRERQPSVDFSSLQRLAYLLGKLFWADLEAHHPGIDSLKLPRDVAAAWKQRVMTRTKTAARRRPGRPDRDRPAGRPQRADRGPGLLPRHRRMGRRRPGPLGAARRALPGQRQRRLPQEGPLPAQVPDGPADPGTAARCCPPWPPGPRPSAPAAAAAAAGRPATLPRARCSPPAGRRCAGR